MRLVPPCRIKIQQSGYSCITANGQQDGQGPLATATTHIRGAHVMHHESWNGPDERIGEQTRSGWAQQEANGPSRYPTTVRTDAP